MEGQDYNCAAAGLISIIMPSLNQGKYLDQAILSVLDQTYPHKELIVVDGGSTDESVGILKKYGHSIRWVSELDNGQADALNKGLRMANGEIIGWLNSDDYYETNALSIVADLFKRPDVQWLVGDVAIVFDVLGTADSHHSPEITYKALLRDPDMVRQQGTFFRSLRLRQVGGWNACFQLVMDYDLWIRLAKCGPPLMVQKQFAFFRMHAEQKTSGRIVLRQLREIRAIHNREGAPLKLLVFLYFRKLLILGKHFLKNILIDVVMFDKRFKHVPYSARKLPDM